MPLVGFEMYIDADDQFAYRPMAGKLGTYLSFYPSAEQSRYSRHRTALQHLAFMVPTRSAVNSVHTVVAELAASAGVWRTSRRSSLNIYSPTSLWLGPWAFMLEAVCHHDRD